MNTAAGARAARRNRWAISFADLCLLMLGFFVLLQANSSHKREVMNELARQFGAPQSLSRRLVAHELFQPGEAMLTPAGAARLAAIARSHTRTKGGIEIHSVGQDRTTTRYDSWDLAAARLGAVARMLAAGGIDRRRITIRGLDQEQAGPGEQVLTLVFLPAK